MSRIALVDDDRNILTSVAMTLEAEGFEVETYNDGQSAFEAFSRRMPDMAVLDIKMPRMDGMETLRRLRQKSDLPVIFLTSKDEEIDELFGLKMGADDFIRKPFSQRLLVERVKAVLRRAIPMATLNTTETAWEVNLKTSVELYTIWEMTGVLDQLEGIDENLFDVITDIMEEKRADWQDFLEEQEDADNGDDA